MRAMVFVLALGAAVGAARADEAHGRFGVARLLFAQPRELHSSEHDLSLSHG